MQNNIMIDTIIRITIYSFSFILAFIMLKNIKIEIIFKKIKPAIKILIYIIFSMALAYLIGSFILEFLPNFSNIENK